MSVKPAFDDERKRLLLSFQKKCKLRFKSLELLNLSFCHRSWSNEKSDNPHNNERLEFLGDSVLGMVVAGYLFENYPHYSEGELAKIKAFVVSEESLASIALSLHLPDFLLLGKGEEMSGGRNRKAILADALEAVIGAIYSDSGIKNVQDFILAVLIPEIENVVNDKHKKDYKTLLQEAVQKNYKMFPRYVLTSKSGPDHDKIFWMEVHIAQESFGPASGSNKKMAEQACAQIAWQALFSLT